MNHIEGNFLVIKGKVWCHDNVRIKKMKAQITTFGDEYPWLLRRVGLPVKFNREKKITSASI